MKNALVRFKNWVMNRKVVDLDNDGKIETLSQEVEGIFAGFKRMSNQLDAVDTNLSNIIKEEDEKKRQAEVRMINASQQMRKNKELKDKLKDFIV